MKNATIATSRTRATADHLIDYRPLPAAWGDRTALQEVRMAKARAVERGLDASTLEISAASEQHARPVTTSSRDHRGHRGLFASLFAALFAPRLREPDAHHRPRHSRGHLATT